ncbi:S1 family peptidase [Enterovirga sp.]|uniref:S1 family peptidase n=1 Tax=Enterovirga sp. TaxID=2026350 RepID=UPI00261497B8|nr:S1 family peptidase [Enterovirga sp.]MDB5592158.1 peptidase [Enterovirga sp.]
MSPGRFEGARHRRGWAWAALGAALAAWSGPAAAVVGGQQDAGPLSRATVMLLSSRGGVCSAVVVARDAVLTAAHCASGADQYRVHLPGGGATPILMVPAAVALHPGYVRGAVRDRRRSVDLALVRTGEELPPTFVPATLSTRVPAKGEAVTLGGYGLSREGDPRSTGQFRSVGLTAVEPHGPGRILLWAAPAPGRPAGACEGDSGGPVVAPDGTVAAISSWATGRGAARCGEMSQAVMVSPQRRWIDETLGGWGRAAVWR